MKSKDISIERKKYLNKIKMQKISVLLTQIGLLVGFIALWEFLANSNMIDSFITSQPSKIIKTLINLTSNDLLHHISVTVYETVVGFVFGTLLGIVIAIILWWSKFLAKVADPFLVVLNSLPKVALRTNNYYMGRSWNFSNHSYGYGNFTSCNNTRDFKWIYKYRQRTN